MKYPAPEGPAVTLRRSVIDAKGANVAIEAFNDCITRYAEPPENLQRSISNARDGFRANHLSHRTFVGSSLAPVEEPRGMPDRQLRGMDIHRIVCQHERNALVLSNWLSECCAPSRKIRSNLLGPDCGPQPAHAMGK